PSRDRPSRRRAPPRHPAGRPLELSARARPHSRAQPDRSTIFFRDRATFVAKCRGAHSAGDRFSAVVDPGVRPGEVPGMAPVIHPPTGTTLSCKGWIQEAAFRMIQHNLDPDVAERPDDLVVYGGTGKAARDWPSFHKIL